MANTSISYYQAVAWGRALGELPEGGPLLPLAPPVVLQQEELQTPALQLAALLAATWSVSNLLPKQQGRQHFKTALLKWLSGTDLLLCALGCIMSLGTNGISLASLTDNLPLPSGSVLCQALQFVRLTMMVWYIRQSLGSPDKTHYGQQVKRKISTSTQIDSESEFLMDFISRSLDKFIIIAVLIASVLLFFNSVLYLAVKSLISLIYKSHFYKCSLKFGKQLISHMAVHLGKHPMNRKLMVLVPTSLVISACVSSVQAINYE